MEENMKKFSMGGLAVWMALLALGFPGCDASLDPSDEGDSAISKPRGELTITGSITDTIIGVRVYNNTTSRPGYLDVATPGGWSSIASAGPISNSKPTVILSAGGSPWNGTGTYGVFLASVSAISNELEPGTTVGHWKVIAFENGRATVGFDQFGAITVPTPPDEGGGPPPAS
jgi:hypothetical protein